MSQPFTQEWSDEFAVYHPPDPGGGTGRDPERWRLTVRSFGIDSDWSATTGMDFTVESGRDDPDEQPQPGRASFTLRLSDNQRAAAILPGSPLWFDVGVGTGPARDWRRVWTGIVTDVTRAFTSRDGAPSNTVRVDAVGPLAQLERVTIPDSMAGAYPEQRDGLRVWTVLYQLGVQMSTVRPETGHLVNDTFPDHAGWWDDTTATVTGGTPITFTRTVAMPAVTGAPRRIEVVVAMTLSHAANVVVAVEGHTVDVTYAEAGSFVLTGEVELPADVASPTLTVTVVGRDDEWMLARWPDLAGMGDPTWATIDAGRTWAAVPTGEVATTATLHDVNVWRSGWDWGTVMLIARDPTANSGQTARDHIEEVARCARGVLWEQRDGGLQYASAAARAPGRLPTLNLPAGVVIADTESTQTLSGLVNYVTVEYWWSGIDPATGQQTPRPSVTQADLGSIAAFGGDPAGKYAATITGPLRDRASAVATAQQVLRASSLPRERISALRLVDLADMDEVTAVGVLTVPPGALIQVDGTPPAGWVPSGAGGAWRGYLEGWTLTGDTDGDVAVTFAVSEYYEAVTGAVPAGQLQGTRS